MEYFVLNDIELCFKDILKRSLSNEPLLSKEEFAAWEKRRQERKQNGADVEGSGGDDDVTAMDTSESTEDSGKKKNGKKDAESTHEDEGKDENDVEGDESKKKKENGTTEDDDSTEKDSSSGGGTKKDGGGDDETEKDGKKNEKGDDNDVEAMDTTEESSGRTRKTRASAAKTQQQQALPTPEKDRGKLKAEKARAVERAAIHAPQLNLQQIEAAIAKGGAGAAGYDHEMINDLMAQTYAASVKWPCDKVLQVRLQHILEAVETGKWPVPENCILLDLVVAENGSGADTPVDNSANNTAVNTPAVTPGGNHARDTSTPLSEMSEVSGYEDANVLTHGGLANRKKRGRRPLDVSDEKAKVIKFVLKLVHIRKKQLGFCYYRQSRL